MGLGMRQVERSAEHVAELVVECHGGRAEDRAAQPGAVERVAARVAVGGIARDPRQGRSEGADPLLRHQREDGVAVPGVKPLDGMGHGVHARGDRQAGRQRERQRDIVDNQSPA